MAPPYPITRGQVLTVLPLGDRAVTISVTGAELDEILEHGVSTVPAGWFAQVSGVCVTYDISAPVGARVVGAVRQGSDGSCSETSIDLTAAATYCVAANDFIAAGGAGYPDFTGRFTLAAAVDEVVIDWLATHGTISPSIEGRITCTSRRSDRLFDAVRPLVRVLRHAVKPLLSAGDGE